MKNFTILAEKSRLLLCADFQKKTNFSSLLQVVFYCSKIVVLFVEFKPDVGKGCLASEAISEGSGKEAKVDSGKASDFLDFSTRNCHDYGGTRAMNPIIFLNYSNLALSKIFVKTSAIWSSVLTHWMTRTS